MTTNSPNSTPLRDVLYTFSLAQPVPDAALLDEFTRRYPQHASALTDFAIELLVDAAWRNEDLPVENINPIYISPTVSRAMSRFQNRAFAVKRGELGGEKPTPVQSSPVENPFVALNRQEFRSLAERLDVNTLFLTRLRDREIDSGTITNGFRQCIADELRAPTELVAAHFEATPEMNRRQLYKADEKPQVHRKRSFEDAVRSSGLSEKQQRRLMKL